MYRRQEGHLRGFQNIDLFFQIWENPNARGTVIITHGQGEHSECYQRLVDAFKNGGWSFWAWDMRGHGQSEGKRGYAADFDNYVRDYQIFLDHALNDARIKGKPTVLLSHSMGGTVQLKTLIEKPGLPVTAQVCSAPLLGVAVPVPAIKDVAATVANSVYPQITMWNEIRNDMLTRDPEVIREFEQDVLRHDRISPGVYLGFKRDFEWLAAKAHEITLPTLFQLPEKDPVVSTEAGKAFFEKISSAKKELRIYGDGARHEMYNDVHRQQVFADLKAWLDPFLGA